MSRIFIRLKHRARIPLLSRQFQHAHLSLGPNNFSRYLTHDASYTHPKLLTRVELASRVQERLRCLENATRLQSSRYRVQERPLGETKPLRVIIVGAGISGLNMIHSLQKQTTNVSYIIYEKNTELGGTWYENRYPGCATDDPSHAYQFSHTPNRNWSSLFAPAGEIKQYLNDFVDRNELRKHIHYGYSVTSAEWQEQSGDWVVKVIEDGTGVVREDRAQVLVDATGIFNQWKWPDIEGLDTFQGPLIHTANWPADFKYQDKTVAVLGNGASGVQLVPAIQPDVKKLVHSIRAPTWIAPPSKAVQFCRQYTGNSTNQFSRRRMRNILGNLDEHTEFTQHIDDLSRKERFKTILNSSEEANSSRKKITRYMAKELRGNEELIKALVPTTPVGCRRITGSTTYLEAVGAPNVELVTSKIREITASGILQESRRHIEVDAIICATGFNTSFVPRFPIVGDYGRNLQEVWLEENGGPKAYMSVMAEGMPNYFRFFGPNGPLAHGVMPRLSSHICSYILSHIQKMQFEHLSSVRPLPGAVEDFNEHVQTFMPRTAWATDGCGGWYKAKTSKDGKEGKVIALHPGSQTYWEELLARVRWEDFEFRRGQDGGGKDNRFAYLGNGFAVSEVEGDDLDDES